MDPQPPASPRPQQVTLAGWFGVGGGLALVISALTLASRLHSVDFRDTLREYLGTSPGNNLGIGVSTALEIVRWGIFVTGGVAAALTVAAIFTLRGDRSARVAMMILAVPTFIVGIVVDPILAGFVVAGAVLLLGRQASAWFSGKPMPEPKPVLPESPAPPVPMVAAPPFPIAAPVLRPRRPGGVMTAAILTWLFSAGMVLFSVLALIGSGTSRVRIELQRQFDSRPELRASQITLDDLINVMRVLLVLMILWCIAAMVLALFVVLRHNWARITMDVSAGIAGATALFATVGFPPFLIVAAACFAVIALLHQRPADEWFRATPPPFVPQRPW